MADWIKRHYLWVVSGVVLIVLLLPLGINASYLIDTEYCILHRPSEWTMFWATYLAAIASFAMVLVTWWTLKQNKEQNDALIAQNEEILRNSNEQLLELKRQWDETNRARLTFSIISYDGLFLLKITNCGTMTAFNVSVIFNKEFIDNHFSSKIKDSLLHLGLKPFCIEAGVSKYYYLSPIYSDSSYNIGNESFTGDQVNRWLNAHKSDKICLSGSYNDKYRIAEEFSIEEFINGGIIVKDELALTVERMKKGMVVSNTQYYPIQRSLSVIAKHVEYIERLNRHKDSLEDNI